MREKAINTTEKTALIEETLMRAAEHIGDVTAPAMEAFYRRYPEARAVFESLSLGWRAQLEGQMIENSVYCLMRWVESPGEIEIMLHDSVPHHNNTLHVPPEWYGDMIELTAEVIAGTIPADNTAELAAWNQVRNDLRGVIDSCRTLIDRQVKH